MSSPNSNNINLLSDSTDIQTITQIVNTNHNIVIAGVANLQTSLNTLGANISTVSNSLNSNVSTINTSLGTKAHASDVTSLQSSVGTLGTTL